MIINNYSFKNKINITNVLYSIDEYRTSLLNYKTDEMSENLYLPDKKK